MNKLDEDLDDSSLFCKSLIQKHKGINSQQSKQLKLTFYQSSRKTNQSGNYKQEENSSGSKTKSIKSNDDWSSDVSESRYFHAKVSTNSCPLCLKSFNTDSAYSAHMKQCAKTHQMTTQQLLKALELQKTQMQQRRDLGLCSQIVPLLKKSATKKNIKNDKESYDLALGLALSKSLITCEKKGASSQEVQKATLEEFGFKSNTAITSRKKHDNEKKSVLKDRTTEERQKIIVEKVAVVLLDEDIEEKNFKKEKLNQNSSFQNHQGPQLWNLGENDENCEWYVSEIKPLILLKEENIKENIKPTLLDNIKNEITKLNLPRKEIFNDWKKMINNDFKSDWVGRTKDGQNIYLHSLVLFARCPEMLEINFELVFQKFNLSTVTILLEYLYCGTLNSLIRSEINNLFDLVVELKFNELINVLNHLKSDLLENNSILNAPKELVIIENNDITHEEIVNENKQPETVEEQDLFTEDVVNLNKSSPKQVHEINENSSENESNAEKSYWSFIQHQKEKENMLISRNNTNAKTDENQRKERLLVSNNYDEKEEKEKNLISTIDSNKLRELNGKLSNDSETEDLIDEFQNRSAKMSSSDCIIISSGSESKREENSLKSQGNRSNTPSSVDMEYEIPHFDFHNDFHCFSEEQFSPVGLQSQSLLMGDISAESLKLSNPLRENVKPLDHSFQEKLKEIVGYCSTPVSVRRFSKIKLSNENPIVKSNKRKGSDLSANRILRKSLNLQHKVKNSKSKKNIVERRRSSYNTKRFAKALTNSILNELSRSSAFNSSPLRAKKFVEITPINNGEEFGESVTPSPNYSNMGGSMLKEQLTRYGLKKNLAKSKAKKILNYIYEELHPLYNVKTKKIVKMLRTNSPKEEKNSKSKASYGKNAKITQNKNEASKEKSKSKKITKDHLNFSNGSEVMTDTTIHSLGGSINQDSDGSEFDDLNETLTQSVPNNPVDLPSVFGAFIQNNPEYHQKILLYEPIWLEELQKKLKETFKKHFKLCDIMDFLDQKCITFRSAAQAKRLQKKNEKKGNSKKKKRPQK